MMPRWKRPNMGQRGWRMFVVPKLLQMKSMPLSQSITSFMRFVS